MTPLALTVFVASLSGSLHCAGMCGGLVAFAAGTDRSRRPLPGHLAYHTGRFTVYVTLGALAGGLGAGLDLAGRAAGLRDAALATAAVLMLAWGLLTLLRHFGVPLPRFLGAPAGHGLAGRVYRRLAGRPPVVRAAALGMLTPLLPCGWLYAFAVTAAGTGSALSGALLMAAFFLGTVPALAAVGVSVQLLAGRLRRHLPVMSALALVVVGLVTLAGRASYVPPPPEPAPAAAHDASVPSADDCPCHER